MSKINQQELARRLNLSQTTISRSLANHPAINSQTKAKVLEAAAKMGYSQRIKRPSHPTRGAPPAVAGVLISTPRRRSNIADTFQEVLRGVADKSSLHQTILDVVYHDPAEGEQAQLMRRIRSANWRGCIFIYPADQSLVHEIAHAVASVSIVENYRHDLIDSIDVDQSDGILSLVQYLKTCGHRKVGFLTWVYDVPTPWVMHRFGSFVEGIFCNHLEFDVNLTINIHQGEHYSPAEAAQKVSDWMKEGVTAVICPADHQAYQLMHDLEQLGIRVPEDISLCGFDGVPPPMHARQLATIKVPYEELGRSAVHQLLRRMEQPTAPRRHILVDGEFVRGETVNVLTA